MPSSFSLTDFITEVRRGGVARNNRFEVLITGPFAGSPNNIVSLFCEISRLPGMEIVTKQNKIFGPSYQIPLTAEYGGDEIKMTFLVDRDMMVRRFFDDWMHTISNAGYFDINYQETYVRDIYIRQLNEAAGLPGAPSITYDLLLHQAFPRKMEAMELNNTTKSNGSDSSIHKLDITFSYRYWERLVSDLMQPEIRHYPTEEGSALPAPIFRPPLAPSRGATVDDVLATGEGTGPF